VSRSLFSLMAINCLGRRVWILLNKIMTANLSRASFVHSPGFSAALIITRCLIMYTHLTPCSFCNRLLIKIALFCSLFVINVCFWYKRQWGPHEIHFLSFLFNVFLAAADEAKVDIDRRRRFFVLRKSGARTDALLINSR